MDLKKEDQEEKKVTATIIEVISAEI